MKGWYVGQKKLIVLQFSATNVTFIVALYFSTLGFFPVEREIEEMDKKRTCSVL